MTDALIPPFSLQTRHFEIKARVSKFDNPIQRLKFLKEVM